jgi:hypothetical protein
VNRACAADDDCVAVGTGCHTFENGLCNATPLNRRAAESATWERLSNELNRCRPEDCATCAAALVLTCNDGFCGRGP